MLSHVRHGPCAPRRVSVARDQWSSAEVAAWIDDELAAIASPGFRVASGEVPDPGARLVVRPRIVKAYVDGVVFTKTAVVVLAFDVTAQGGEAVSRMYRGQQAGVNWAASQSEGFGALRDAAMSCLEQLRADLERMLHPSAPVPRACAPLSPEPEAAWDR